MSKPEIEAKIEYQKIIGEVNPEEYSTFDQIVVSSDILKTIEKADIKKK